MRTHTHTCWDMYTVSVSQSKRGNLVFSFDRVCVYYYLHRCMLLHILQLVIRVSWPCTVVAVCVRKPWFMAGPVQTVNDFVSCCWANIVLNCIHEIQT